MMKYHLYKDEDVTPGNSIATAALANNHAAVEWARTWVEEHGGHDLYTLERDDGTFAAILILTAGGNWYFMTKKGLEFTD